MAEVRLRLSFGDLEKIILDEKGELKPEIVHGIADLPLHPSSALCVKKMDMECTPRTPGCSVANTGMSFASNAL